MRKIARKVSAAIADDSGLAGLLIAGLIAIIAFTAITVFFRSAANKSQFERIQSSYASVSAYQPALTLQLIRSKTLPCPDRNQDGNAETTCDGTGSNYRSGTLPWINLGISRDDVIDGYGNFYTYIISSDAKNVCFSVGNDYDSSVDAEYTGSIIESSDLETLATTSGATASRKPFVVISHGPNGFGAISSTGAARADPPSANTYEVANAGDVATALKQIYTGPFDDTSANVFDDQVYVPSTADLQKACEELTPGGTINATLTDNFDSSSTGLDTTKFDTTGSTTPPTKVSVNNNGVARFTNSTSYLATNSTNYNFSPTVRPVYVSAEWTPTSGGFSVVTRATVSTLVSGDNFGTGITFRFGTTVGSNSLQILDNNANVSGLVQNGTFTLTNGATYILEVYDNGSDVWARITQSDNTANTASAYAANVTPTTELSGDQRIIFVNGSSQSDLDEILIGIPMLSLDLNGTNAYASSTAGSNMLGGSAPRSMSVEAWVKADTFPTGSNAAVIAAQWDTGNETGSGYRLYLNSGEVHLRLSDGTTASTVDGFFSPDLGEWTHIAATYDASTGAVSFYKNGDLVRTATSSIGTSNGVNNSGLAFTVGADSPGSANFFDGQISDVRVWRAARTARQISACFQSRIPSSDTTNCATTNAVVNWRLDPRITDGGLTSTAVAANVGTAGTVSANARYSAGLAQYFRPFSTNVCAGYKVGAYQCDFRLTSSYTTGVAITSITVPSNMSSFYAKVWGAGGGGYDVTTSTQDRTAGSGGFSAGLIERIDSAVSPGTLVNVAGQPVTIYVGGGGAASTTNNIGANGGGGSGIYNAAGTPVAALVAGGGGGASYSVAGTCPSSGTTQCGLGGSGSGASSTASRPPAGSTNCSGREGSQVSTGTGPPTTGCPDGGGQPSTGIGGGPDSGGTFALRGGGGYTASTTGTGKVGGGGAGGGLSGGEAGGHDDGTSNSGGYGGGGGSGTAAGGVQNASGAAGSFSGAGTDTSRVGDLRSSPPAQATTITNISPQLTGTWSVGDAISATGIPGGTTITSISGNNKTVDISQAATVTQTGVALTVTLSSGAISSNPGGSSDRYYFPSYLNSTTAQSPGLGGTTGSSNRDGKAGAVVLLW